MAYLSYNGFNHPAGQVDVKFHFDAILNEGDQIVAYKARSDIVGKLISTKSTVADCQADITAQIEAIQDAYVDGGDLILTLDDGSQSANSIINSVSLGGTKIIVAPSFPDGGQAQYATQRDFVIAIEAEVPTLDGTNALWSFEESLTFQGTGGPAIEVIECVQGDPVIQTIKQRTSMTAIQEGKAVGYLAYRAPLYQNPIWPSIEQLHLRIQQLGSPERTGNGVNTTYKKFPSRWRYTFKSSHPILGTPSVWPV